MTLDHSRGPILIYPELGAAADLGFLRVSGAGLGNGFFAYFHAATLARLVGGKVVSPPWVSLKPARILRGRFGDRAYFDVARALQDEVSGFPKLCALTRPRCFVNAADAAPDLRPGYLNVLSCRPFVFGRLRQDRELVRRRLLALTRSDAPANGWGGGGYIALHVRLGDFGPEMSASDVAEGRTNRRLPFSWYLEALDRVRIKYPHMPVYVVSDGADDELAPLIQAGVTPLRSGSDIADLLALAGSSVLIGSNSTFSQWGAFLGDMPSVWLDKPVRDEKPTSEGVPVIYVALGGQQAK